MDISIIEVDLGIDVNTIINEHLSHITKKNTDDIKEAIDESHRINAVKDAKVAAEQALAQKLQSVLDALLEAQKNNKKLIGSQLLTIVNPEISTLSSLVSKIKSMMKQKGTTGELCSTKIKKDTYYFIESV